MNVEIDIALERIVTAKGIELVTKGKVLVGRCPFGEHAAASLIVDPKANTWTCVPSHQIHPLPERSVPRAAPTSRERFPGAVVG